MNPRLQLNYVHSTAMGYGRLGTKLAAAVSRRGVEVIDQKYHVEGDIAPHGSVRESLSRPITTPTKVISWVSVPSHCAGWLEGQRPIILTMWEATHLPETFRENMHNFERIIVPSEQNLELFSQFHDNVVKIPLGVDSEQWKFVPRTQPEDQFLFMIGGSGDRKGLDVAHKAFARVFGSRKSWRDGPEPHLIFKSPRYPDVPRGPSYTHIGGFISDADEIALYARAHCYLQPSRGEGWGLQPLQAIAQGCPTILTDAHGQAEFAHLGYGLSSTMAPATYFSYGDPGEWWEPSLDELCTYMEYVYKNYDEACGFAEIASKVAHEQFNWDLVAGRYIDALGGLEALCEEYAAGPWVPAKVKQYPMTVRRDWSCDIAGISYRFHVGEHYYVPADVKRILFEAGDILDPSCMVNEDTGLTETQLATVPDILNRAQYCEHCHQKLGSGVLYEPK